MFRFTLRDLFWLTVVVAACLAVFLGFRAERIALKKQAQQAEEAAQQATEMLLSPPGKLRVGPSPPMLDAPKRNPNASDV